jgi:hypothetical protein
MKDHEPEREREREKEEQQQAESAYRSSVRDRLQKVSDTEALYDKQARKRTGILSPVRLYGLYGQKGPELSAEFHSAMQRLWDIGTIDAAGRADTELRRPYHLIAKGGAPLTEADVIKLGQMPERALRLLLPWLSHRLSLSEAQDNVDFGKIAPPIIQEETT